MSRFVKQIQPLFYFAFGAAALMQAYHTPLLEDEAYYFLYSLKPAFGYFDHPPVVAWLIRAGTLLLQDESGVRIFMIVLGLITIRVTETIAKPGNRLLYYLLVLSIPMIHVTSFVATPDAPLWFFTALFLLTWQQYLKDRKTHIALLAGVLAAGMMLSKYQGVLVIAFTVLANLREVRLKKFWLMAATAALCMIPHLLWQIKNDFPTFQYHLLERAPENYSLLNTFIYLPGQLLVFGVLTAPLILFATFRKRASDPFEKVLQFNVAGFLLFFLLMSLKGQVEPHWTLPAVIPALILACRYAEKHTRFRNGVYATALIMVALIVPARILITSGHSHLDPVLPQVKNPFADAKTWTTPLQRVAGDRPVAFMNSYQKASLYTFYTGMPAMSLNNVMGRKNQFDIWQSEEYFRGKEVVVVPNYNDSLFGVIKTPSHTLRYRIVDSFQAFSRIRIVPHEFPQPVSPGETFPINILLRDRCSTTPDLNSNPEAPVRITCQIFRERTLIDEQFTGVILTNGMINKSIEVLLRAPDQPGEYSFHLSLTVGWLPPSFNSNRYSLVVSDQQ
jgi:hypothetical protein